MDLNNCVLLDLFAGIGGFHLGLTQAGFNFRKVCFSEVDKHAIKIYNRRFSDAECIGAIESIRSREIERPNIITFGSPCQDFSIAGKRAGMDGQRSSLVSEAIRLVDEFRPDFFIWENVKGAFSSNSGKDFWSIIKAFTNIGGYRLEWQLLNTAWFLPQNRERIFLTGYNPDKCRGEIFPIGEPDKVSDKGNTEKQIATTLQSPGHASGNYRGMNMIFDYRKDEGFRYRKNGFSPSLLAKQRGDVYGQPLILQKTRGDCTTKRYGVTGTLQSGGQSVSDKIPCIPITNHDCHDVMITNPKMNKYTTDNIKHSVTITASSYKEPPVVNNFRRLTPIEYERLQGFPDNWTDGLSDTQRYKTLGNAVSVPVVKAVGERIIRSMI